MTVKFKFFHKVLSVALCMILLISYVPFVFTASAAASVISKSADPSTMNDWKNYFLPTDGSLSTENAGGIWTDKSVFTDASAFTDYGISLKDENNMLVALSAIGSNMAIIGSSGISTDTILVLDVSGSMGSGYNNVASELVDAANTSLSTLLGTSEEPTGNRVGVVLYGASATTLLPLDSYTTAADGKYLTYSGGEIGIDWDVFNSKNDRPTQRSRSVTGGTNIQSGIIDAMQEFTSSSNTNLTNRKPVMVIMSDGAPTYGNTDYKALQNNRFGTGSSSSSALGFVTQLSASYAKQQIKEKYNTDPLFYTLALAIGSGRGGQNAAIDKAVATSVLDPSQTSSDIKELWTRYDNTAAGRNVNIGNNRSVTKTQGLSYSYVDRFFNSDDYTNQGTNTLAQALKDAFEEIVNDIALQSAYYPTLVQGETEFSGYITFNDVIGEYMNVTDFKGIIIGDNTLFSGKELSKNFVPQGGLLGTAANPNTLGNEMLNAVMQRLGITDSAIAGQVIENAYNYKQLYYDSTTGEFSNYIGWYADEQNKYVGFWYEGDPNPAPANAKYIVKSYGYLGEVNHHTNSDMMFATVQVRYDILTDEETVVFSVPAALIPVVTYNVTLDENEAITKLTASGATAPIRLVYEIGLDSDIDEYNIKNIIDDTYLTKEDWQGNKSNVGANGEVYFYTNQYEIAETQDENIYGYGNVNTFSYFRPSRENDRYYYQEDTPIYSDTNGTPATQYAEGNKYYHAYKVYTKSSGGALEEKKVYHELATETVRDDAQIDSYGNLYVPAGHVRRDYSNLDYEHHNINKTENTTNTLPAAAYPFTDVRGQLEAGGGSDYSFVFGVTLGNNGRISLMPATGINIAKWFNGTTDDMFTFTVTGNVPNGNYTARLLNSNWEVDTRITSVAFSGGVATVTLKANEQIDIVGLPADVSITVSEILTDKYILSQNTPNNVQQTTIAQNIVPFSFENELRGAGNLTISKIIEHNNLGNEFVIDTTEEFKFTATLSLEGVSLIGKQYATSLNGAAGSVTVDRNSQITVTLKHNNQFTVSGLPDGTVVTVVETQVDNYTADYWENGAQTTKAYGEVIIEKDNTKSVMAVNTYDAIPVTPNPEVEIVGTKTLTGNRTWEQGDSFTFQIQKWDEAAGQWISTPISETTLTIEAGNSAIGTNNAVEIPFTNKVLENEVYDKVGTYHYRVIEIEPTTAEPGMSYDKTIHAFDIVVSDKNYDGKLEINKVTKTIGTVTNEITPVDNVYTVETNFTNNYDAGLVTQTIEINKSLFNPTNSPYASREGFRFKLTADTNNPDEDPVTADIISDATTIAGVTRFNLIFKNPGTYVYNISEVNDNKAGYSYSANEYKVTVTVNDTNPLTASTSVELMGQTPTASTLPLVFQNTYLKNKKAELEINFVTKELQNKDLVGGEFKFEVYEYNNSTAVLNGTNDASGEVTFNGNLSFEKVGTYFYDIKEVNDGLIPGVKYDETVYRVEVIVTDNQEGELAANYSVVNVAGNKAEFVNIYTPKSTDYTIIGNKSIVDELGNLSQRPLRYNEFTFVLTELESDMVTEKTGGVSYETKNNLDGSFSFLPIQYNAAGSYFYKIVEKNAGQTNLGLTNTEKAYIVEVKIRDNKDLGQLEFEAINYIDEAVQELSFKNVYKAEKTNYTISGIKDIDGRELNSSDVYTFKLYNEAGAEIDSKTNDQYGEFAFDTIEYTDVGVYNYTVKEVQGEKSGITFDQTVFKVRVEVTDDYLGSLKATAAVHDEEGNPRAGVTFINTYKVTENASFTLSGEKILTGRDLEDEEFIFELFNADEEYNIIGDAIDSASNAYNELTQKSEFKLNLVFTPDQIGQTLYYVLKEFNDGVTGVTYSEAVYRIKVVVEDSLIGAVKATYTITDGTKEIDSNRLDFTNEFEAATSVDVNIAKKVENKGTESITPENFEFMLEKIGTDDKFTVKSDADGLAKFVLNFTEKDIGQTYNYKLTEVNTGVENVKYSTAEYAISISISLNDDYQLVATVIQDELPVDVISAEFINEYDYTPTTPEPSTPTTPPVPSTSPNTGAHSNIYLLLALFFVSSTGLMFTILYCKKREEQAE